MASAPSVPIKSNSGVEQKFADVLQLVLQHSSPEAVTPQLLCSLLQVSTACRTALQQARAHCTVGTTAQHALQQSWCFSSFCCWLPKHQGLISTLKLFSAQNSNSADAENMQNVLLLALQACKAATATAPAQLASGHAATPPPLQLQCIETNIISSTAAMSAIAAMQLHSLEVDICVEQLTPARCKLFGKLHGLQDLSVSCVAPSRADLARQFEDLAAGIGQLRSLTRLTLSPARPYGLQALPQSLQYLGLLGYASSAMLAGVQPAAAAAAEPVSLLHLTALQQLSVMVALGGSTPKLKAQLPPSLSSLSVHGSMRLHGQHRPTAVDLEVRCARDLMLLHDLITQQQPWCLEVTRDGMLQGGTETAIAASAALASCTSLTSFTVSDADLDPLLPWMRHAAALRKLRLLDITNYEQSEADMLGLTALTALTQLRLGNDVNDLVVVSLACNLTGLCHLQFLCDKVHTVGIFPALAKLTGLKNLTLESEASTVDITAKITPLVLSQLLPLTQLTHLQLPLGDACPGEAQQQFLAHMPGLTCIGTVARFH